MTINGGCTPVSERTAGYVIGGSPIGAIGAGEDIQ